MKIPAILVSFLLLNACSRYTPPEIPKAPHPQLLPEKIVYTVGGETVTYQYQFDAEHHLTKVTGSGTQTFTYTNGRLTKAVIDRGDMVDTTLYQYNSSGQLTTSQTRSFTNTGVDRYTLNTTYTHSGGTITVHDQLTWTPNTPGLVATEKYFFENSQIVKITGQSTLYDSKTDTYTYGAEKGIFSNLNADAQMRLILNRQLGHRFAYGSNALKTFTSINSGGYIDTKLEYTYQLNSDQFPQKAAVKETTSSFPAKAGMVTITYRQ